MASAPKTISTSSLLSDALGGIADFRQSVQSAQGEIKEAERELKKLQREAAKTEKKGGTVDPKNISRQRDLKTRVYDLQKKIDDAKKASASREGDRQVSRGLMSGARDPLRAAEERERNRARSIINAIRDPLGAAAGAIGDAKSAVAQRLVASGGTAKAVGWLLVGAGIPAAIAAVAIGVAKAYQGVTAKKKEITESRERMRQTEERLMRGVQADERSVSWAMRTKDAADLTAKAATDAYEKTSGKEWARKIAHGKLGTFIAIASWTTPWGLYSRIAMSAESPELKKIAEHAHRRTIESENMRKIFGRPHVQEVQVQQQIGTMQSEDSFFSTKWWHSKALGVGQSLGFMTDEKTYYDIEAREQIAYDHLQRLAQDRQERQTRYRTEEAYALDRAREHEYNTSLRAVSMEKYTRAQFYQEQ